MTATTAHPRQPRPEPEWVRWVAGRARATWKVAALTNRHARLGAAAIGFAVFGLALETNNTTATPRGGLSQETTFAQLAQLRVSSVLVQLVTVAAWLVMLTTLLYGVAHLLLGAVVGRRRLDQYLQVVSRHGAVRRSAVSRERGVR